MNHYNYILVTESLPSDLFYIGVRSSRLLPEDDTEYMSSSRLVESMMFSGVKFRKEIIHTLPSRLEADIAEQNLFDELGCISRTDCINLHSFNTPYSPESAANKILCFKTLIPGWNEKIRTIDRNKRISKEDIKFRIRQYLNVWLFEGHPGNLIEYYTKTGTMVFSPGREDRLQRDSLKKGMKYYVSDMSDVVGTPKERMEILANHHDLPGQHFLVQQEIRRLSKLLGKQPS